MVRYFNGEKKANLNSDYIIAACSLSAPVPQGTSLAVSDD